MVHTFYSKKDIIQNFYHNAPVINSSGKNYESLESCSKQLLMQTEPLSPQSTEFSLALNHQSAEKSLCLTWRSRHRAVPLVQQTWWENYNTAAMTWHFSMTPVLRLVII